ncbi:TRAP transporter small permease [Frigidibacter sp. MR17.24]|uniref:TRAP transporter small permease n=1 Tax=Frigidibacter sp. MR17.24 TaxID=3127345 RepID=UPI003012A758
MLKPIETAVERFSLIAGGLVLVAMMLQVVADVLMRAILGAGFPATPDLVGKYYMVAVSVLPLAVTELKRRHIEATIFTQGLGPRMLATVQLFGFVACAAVMAVLMYGSTLEALRQTARGAYIEAGSIRFVTWPSYWILPFSFGLTLLVMAMRVLSVLTGSFEGDEPDVINQLEPLRENA